MAAQNNAPLPNGLEIAGYHIVKKIGCGGFSIVYLAHDRYGQPVALKEYLPSELALRSRGHCLALPADPGQLALFRLGLRCFFEEARALAQIHHPNVVRALDFFRANRTAYMVMDFEAGCTLQQIITHKHARGERLREAFIVATFVKVGNGVRAMHANHALHLDLKPANIHLRQDGTPVLLDIGGAGRAALQLAHGPMPAFMRVPAQVPIFTPGFAPPELHGGHPGPWSDAYGIGAAIYACMLGAPPPPAARRALEDQTGAQLDSLAGTYSIGLRQLVRQCLMLDPLVRPQSLLALQLRLREIVSDRGLTVVPVPGSIGV
jgi:serine/threonine protein kinase